MTICLLTSVLNSLSCSKNHGRQLESLQASLETEVKAKSDLVGIALLTKETRNSSRMVIRLRPSP